MTTPQEDAAGGATDGTAVLRVVAGSPTPEELAAVTAVLLALEAEASVRPSAVGASTRPSSAWTRSARRGRSIDGPGPGAWGGSVR